MFLTCHGGSGRFLGVRYVYVRTFRFPAEGDADIAAIVLDRAERISANSDGADVYPDPMSEAS